MLSVPPATTTSMWPAVMACEAMTMVWRPEEQNRLTVAPGTSSGSAAFWAMMRPMFIPCGPSGKAQPMMTSSTCSGWSPFTRSMAPTTAFAPISSGRKCRSAPFFAFPTAVLYTTNNVGSVLGFHVFISRLRCCWFGGWCFVRAGC